MKTENQKIVDQITRKLGKITVAVNNTGMTGTVALTYEGIHWKDWEVILDTLRTKYKMYNHYVSLTGNFTVMLINN